MRRISLIPLTGGEPFFITLPMTLVGGKADCDLRLEGAGVTQLHCVLALADELLLLRDLDTDRTRVNGQRVRRAVLLHNDTLTIGTCGFRVQYEGEA